MKKATEKENKVKTNTYNYPPDSHEHFCKRSLRSNNGICPITGNPPTSSSCPIPPTMTSPLEPSRLFCILNVCANKAAS